MVRIRPRDRAEYPERLRIREELWLWKIIIIGARERELRAYNPDQPRAPAGGPDGGQWTSEVGAGDGSVQVAELVPDPNDPNRVISDAGPGDGTLLAQDAPPFGTPSEPEPPTQRDRAQTSRDSGMVLSTNQSKRLSIAEMAESYVGSTTWSYNSISPTVLE